ncbi:Cobyrinic acid ac-diamide synthase [Hyella patelloides LEGE 07179]|uniref:Cobyrinic acid ac-diamide synthase n=1 Tax=Hyella patelloides LEGE 07179 TaxID=945734 RepID=A0A563VTH1_9CYAN|nr:MinD/ParA family protein [Hyella patelloides]VEP14713.1 Cobyrinic acid ac-diamide synthase [Hyella patelloides LEGE 07179]
MAKIIAIHSYRGGTGKSNLTANIATIVAQAGNRVAIVDTDLPSPGIHVLFGLGEEQIKNTLNSYLWGQCALKDTIYNVSHVMTQKTASSAIYLLPSSAKLADISRILREGYDFELLLEGFKKLIDLLELDYLFIDTHPGLNQETLVSLTISNLVLYIMRPDKQDFQGTAVTIDVARRLQVPKVLIIVNKALKEYNFAQLSQEVESTYKTRVAGILQQSDEVMRMASKGIFAVCYPEQLFSRVIKGIARQIIL